MINISFYKFIELQKKGFNLDLIYLLSLIKDNVDLSSDLEKIKNFIQALERKGLITKDHVITLDGQSLLDFVNSPNDEVRLVKVKTDDEFERFWKVFPSTDTFEYKGRKFVGNRALRINKEGCKLKLKSILNSGEYTIDQLIAAINYDVTSKKEASVKTGTNKLSYMQNAATYLNQNSYEPFIELIKQGATIQETETFKNGTDI